MSTIVYQSFQSCYDDTTTTHVSEPWSLSLKLSPPKPQIPPPKCIEPSQKSHAYNYGYNNNSNDTRGGGWSCIESLSTAAPNNFQNRKEEYSALPVYVHPLIKRASSKLSDKSLEMCTENLGCETGTDMITPTSSSFSSFFSSPPPPPSVHVQKKINYDELTSITTTAPPSSSCQRSRLIRSISEEAVEARKKKSRSSCQEFPPPLTSMSGSSSILVRPRREMGRLVMTAVSNSPMKSNIVAERSNGRLRMSLLVDDSEKAEDAEVEEEEEVVGACCHGDDDTSGTTIDELMESVDTMARCDEDEDEDEEEIEIDRRREGEEEELEDNSGGVREEEGDEEGEDGRNVHLEGDKRESGRKMEVVVVRRMAASAATTTTATATTSTTTGDQFHRPSRCKESGRGGTNSRTSTRRLINWETFWVATSS